MKKSLFLSLAILAFYLPANAQLSFGIKVSVTKAWHSSDPSDAPNMQGLSTTLSLYKKLNKFIEVGLEPGIVQRGTTQTFGPDIYTCYLCCFGDCVIPGYSISKSVTGLKASYIQAPLLLQVKLPLANGKLAVFGKTGGGPSWLASGYYDTDVFDDITFETRPENKALDFSKNDSPKRWDIGLNSGAGIGYHLGCGMLTIEMEYYHGLRDVVDYTSFKNRSVSYSLGYAVNL